jgi:hypothetical protein
LCIHADEQNQAVPRPVLSYTAHFKITQMAAMADGKIVTLTSIETAARDSSGRFYSETKIVQQSGETGSNKISSAYVLDPTAGTNLNWNSKSTRAVLYQTSAELQEKLKGCWADEQGKIWERGPEDEDWHPIPVSPPISQSKIWIREPDGVRKQVLLTTQNLGTKTISGFTVRGVRTSYAPLPGEKPDDGTASSTEFWRSDALNLKLSEESTGRGNQTSEFTKSKELIDLKLGKPDPSLFSPPKDYSVDRVELHQVSCGQE